jgi:RNA polymerase sigma-70 factor (ECF subfamily)
LTRLGRARGLDEAAAEDVVQEALAAALARRHDIDHVEAWLVRVVDRRCCDWHRRRSVVDRLCERSRDADTGASAAPPSERIDLSRALALLPSRQRQALFLRYVEGLSSEEAAERMGYTNASYRVTLCRALAALRDRLASPRPRPRPAN